MDKFSFLNAAHTAFFADLYDKYLESPDSVEPSWRSFFQGFDFANQYQETTPQSYAATYDATASNNEQIRKEFAVLKLIDAYRGKGHFVSHINPLKDRRFQAPDLSLAVFGLSEADLQTSFDAALSISLPKSTLSEIISHLQTTYCHTTGVEFMHIGQEEKVAWISKYFESKTQDLSIDQKKIILEKLIEAAAFENFFQIKYVGQKRFSLEGLEATVPALDLLIDAAAEANVKEVIIGMAHRGRLNVLANVLKKPAQNIFTEFDGKDYSGVSESFDGDVKYHLGYSSEKQTPSGRNIQVHLAPNPSHLETVGAVIEGVARARQDEKYSNNFSEVLPIALHGDAAVAGQGIVYEIVQMSKLNGYFTGGTIHLVLNNQVGFTTNNTDARSGVYSTEVAKVIEAPVVHVNADDTEAAVKALLFALAYRQEFKEDVFIDLIGYRKYGHNEGDEPRFTQPLLYKLIAKHANARNLYSAQLLENKIVDAAYIDALETKYKALLEENLEIAKATKTAEVIPFFKKAWQEYPLADAFKMLTVYNTKVSKEVLDEVAVSLTQLPSDKKFIKKITKVISDRNTMYNQTDKLDWAMGELLAYGTLISEGYDVRFSGQDVQRGTFSHRHAVIKDEETEQEYIPLNNLTRQNGKLHIYNSLLSEYAVLGFEYGYALTNPKALTIWEAQFGDFSNGAQIIIDQYISAAEDKWGSQNGIVLLLPHGYENQGAEHSSARLERFLQLTSTQNMYVANCTTPANHFHMLRRQLVTDFRKPLVVMSPKSLLRHPEAVSSKEEFINGAFQTIIDDPKVDDKANVTTLVFVSGKFYYDLQAKKQELQRNDVAIVRLEQLFPLDTQTLKDIIASYPGVTDFVWAQEEPKNMGAYSYMLMNFNDVKFRVAAPPVGSAPAAGSSDRSKARYAHAIEQVFDKNL